MSNIFSHQIRLYAATLLALGVLILFLFAGMYYIDKARLLMSEIREEGMHQHTVVHEITSLTISIASDRESPNAGRDRLQMNILLQALEARTDVIVTDAFTSAYLYPDSSAVKQVPISEKKQIFSEFKRRALAVANTRTPQVTVAASAAMISYASNNLLPIIEAQLHAARHDDIHLNTLSLRWTALTLIVFIGAILMLDRFLFRPVVKKAIKNSEKLDEVQGKMEKQELLDPITGLPNMTSVQKYLEDLDYQNNPETPALVAIMIKLDPVTRGQQLFSDRLNQSIACNLALRLEQLTGEMEFLAHCGQGRFFILCVDDEAEIGDPRILDRIEQILFEPIVIQNSRIVVALRTGFLPVAADISPEELLDDIGIALDIALTSDVQERVRFTEEMRTKINQNAELGAELTRALAQKELRAHFQPQIDLATGRIIGFEALVRWYHPTRGILPPGLFLPLLQEIGLDDALGELMLNEGLEALRSWDEHGFEINQLGLNFSQAQLRDPKVVDTIRWELDRFDLTPERLSIEILENIYVESDEDRIASNVRHMSEMGLKIDLDDFGTGTASITGLRRFRANRIKIDRSYVSNLDSRLDNQKLVSTMINMAQGLGIEALAEGVETEAEMTFLRSLGCQSVQGYFIAKPMSFEDTITWISNYTQNQADRRRNGRAVAV